MIKEISSKGAAGASDSVCRVEEERSGDIHFNMREVASCLFPELPVFERAEIVRKFRFVNNLIIRTNNPPMRVKGILPILAIRKQKETDPCRYTPSPYALRNEISAHPDS